jgi:ABC-type nickel/cobalt efflux system permease component RcnA
MHRSLLPLLFLPLLATSVVAHTLPKCQFDRTVRVRLEPSGVNVTYTLVLSEESMAFDGYTFFTAAERADLRNSPRESFARWYATAKGERIAKSFTGLLDGKDVTFRLTAADLSFLDHNRRFELRLRADWALTPGKPHRFEFTDCTHFVGPDLKSTSDDAQGAVELTIDEREKGSLLDPDWEQPDDLRGKQRSELKPDDEPRRRQCSATFRLDAAKLPSATSTETSDKPTVTEHADDRPLTEQLHDRGLKALLDSNLGVGVLLVLSALFGMAHAFTPGHGKTMVAAYLVGERGTVWHAVTLGLTATVAHTGSVILVAVGLYAFYGNAAPASAQAWLMMLGGLLIFLVGLWLFMQRLRGRADHVHLFNDGHHHHGDHGHHHHGDHDHHHHHAPATPPKTNFGWLRVILLGLGGGIIPCWDAVMMLLVAMAQGQIGFAIPLLLAFSVGLAAVMIALGLAVLYAHRAGGARFGESRWFRMLPVVSALILVLVGVWFLRDGFQMLGAAT